MRFPWRVPHRQRQKQKLRVAWERPPEERIPPQTTRQKQPQGQMWSLWIREICGGCRTERNTHGWPLRIRPACNYIPKVLQEDPKYLEKSEQTQWVKYNKLNFLFYFLLISIQKTWLVTNRTTLVWGLFWRWHIGRWSRWVGEGGCLSFWCQAGFCHIQWSRRFGRSCSRGSHGSLQRKAALAS